MARKVFQVLVKEHVNILAIATSEIRINILVKEKYMELAVRALHDSFALEQIKKIRIYLQKDRKISFTYQ